MSRYNDLTSFAGSLEPARALAMFSEARAAAIRQAHPQAPGDYLEYLQQVGWGSIADGYAIYEGLIAASDIYHPSDAETLKGILFFGDDFSGTCAGFDTDQNWAVVEVDPTTMSRMATGLSFEQFIRRIFERHLGEAKRQ